MKISSTLSDILRCMLVNAPRGANLAVPSEVVHRSRPMSRSAFWRDSLSNRYGRTVVAEWDGLKLRGLISARMLNGPRTWKIDRLYLPGLNSTVETATSTGLDLLEAVAEAAGQQSAERVFLRVPTASPVATMARRTGYFGYYEEVHLYGQPEPLAPQTKDQYHRPQSPMSTEDEFALFQLYCAATPPQIRVGTGLTMDQWRDIQKSQSQNIAQETTWNGGRMIGWVAYSVNGNVTAPQLLHHPEHTDVLALLLAPLCRIPGYQSWLVPDYQEPLGTMLLRQGLKEAGRYAVLVKPLAAPVVSREYSMAEA